MIQRPKTTTIGVDDTRVAEYAVYLEPRYNFVADAMEQQGKKLLDALAEASAEYLALAFNKDAPAIKHKNALLKYRKAQQDLATAIKSNIVGHGLVDTGALRDSIRVKEGDDVV